MSQLLPPLHAHARWEGLGLGYTEAQGLPALREAIAASPCHYSTISAEEVIICAPEVSEHCVQPASATMLRVLFCAQLVPLVVVPCPLAGCNAAAGTLQPPS